MAAKASNLYAAVTQMGSVARLGEVTILRMDGAGAIAVPTMSFTTAARWAQSKPPTGILQKDRMLFLDRFETFLARTASIVQSRGSAKPLYDLLLAMERIGLDIHEWNIPHSVEELIKEAAAMQEPAKDKKDNDAQPNQTHPEPPHQ